MSWASRCRSLARGVAAATTNTRTFAKIPLQGSKAGFKLPIPYTLGQLVKLELLARNDGNQIRNIWEAYHQTKQFCAGKGLTADDHRTLVNRAQRAPLFVHSLRRPAIEGAGEEQFFALISQFSHPHRFLFAQLDHFREFPHLAQPFLVLRAFDDLAQSKGVALLRADAGHTAMSTADCRHLMEALVESYLDDGKYELVRQFNDDPDNFDLDAAIRGSVAATKAKEEADAEATSRP